MKSNFFKYLIPRKDINFMNNKIETFYNTENYKLKLIRTSKVYNYSEYRFICTIEIYDKLDLLINSISTNEVEILKMLDNFYYSIENNMETYSFLNNTDSLGNYNSIKLDITWEMLVNDYIYTMNILKYSAIYSSFNTIASIPFYGLSDISQFLDLLYYTFLVNDVNISSYSIQDQLLTEEFSNRQFEDY